MNTQYYNPLFETIETQIAQLEFDESEGRIDAVKLKNTLENLRSSLEYLAADIKEYCNFKKRSSFPYSDKNEEQFKTYVNQKFPNLDLKYPDLYNTLRDVQPFIKGNNWLNILMSKTNTVKHNTLNVSDKKTFNGTEIVGIANLDNLKNDVFIDLKDHKGHDSGTIEISKDGSMTVRNAKNIHIRGTKREGLVFKSEDVEVIPFLKECLSKIKELIEEVYYYMD